MSRNTNQTDESNSRRVSRRTILGTSGAALATGLAGCAGLTGGSGGSGGGSGGDDTETGDGASEGDVEIDYWMYFGAQETRR